MLPTNSKEDNNKSDVKFDMEMLKWKDNTKTVFISRQNIEEGNNKLYSLLNNQYDPSLKTKLEVTKGCDKSHKSHYRIKVFIYH